MTQSSYPKVIRKLKELAKWEAPNNVMYWNGIGRDDLAIISQALLHIIENQSSHTTARKKDEG